MEVVQRLPRPQNAAALGCLTTAQQILCARAVSEEDCETALGLLEELAAPVSCDGYGYSPALLTLASLYDSGFEPAIERNRARAARYILELFEHEEAAELDPAFLEEAAMQLCQIVKDRASGFTRAEELRLQSVAGATVSAASAKGWLSLTLAEVGTQIQEATEDPEARQRRLAKEAARSAAREEALRQQQAAAWEALEGAEALRLEANDLCRLGQLPGNSAGSQHLRQAAQLYSCAAAALSDTLKGITIAPEAAEVRKQRGKLRANEAQVWLSLQDLNRVELLSQQALEDEPDNWKAWYRLGKARLGLGRAEEAAQTIDDALLKYKSVKGADADSMKLELWQLAEEISKQATSFKWSSSKPEVRQKIQDDFEQRLIGRWQYIGQGASGESGFEIKLESWGALVFLEDKLRIDLMRKSMLTWSGEVEMISGMVLNIVYEPGADIIVNEFVPPPDLPEEKQWKGPRKFSAKRAEKPSTCKEEAEVVEVPPPPTPPSKPEEPAPLPVQAKETVEPAKETQEPVPESIWFTGASEFAGRFDYLPQPMNSKAVYKRAEAASGEMFLWFRGGNWGVTTALQQSSLVAPFLLRAGDPTDRCRHPLELRRPRWYVRRGRGQEELDVTIRVLDHMPDEASENGRKDSVLIQQASNNTTSGIPQSIELLGRKGSQASAVGIFIKEHRRSWAERPVYTHEDGRLYFFFSHRRWVVASEVCAIPRALARSAPTDVSNPANCPGNWEFLQAEDIVGRMEAVDNRIYVTDRQVQVQAVGCTGAIDNSDAAAENVETLREEVPGKQDVQPLQAEPVTKKLQPLLVPDQNGADSVKDVSEGFSELD